MSWEGGKRHGKSYASPEESQKDCVRIWTSYYGRFPDYNLASRYVCGPNAKNCEEEVWGWLATVRQKYSE